MIRMDYEIAQKPMGDVDKFEVIMEQIPTKHYTESKPM